MKRKNPSIATLLAVLTAITFGPMIADRAPVMDTAQPLPPSGLMPDDQYTVVKTKLITGGLLPEATSHSSEVLARYGE